MAIDIRLYRAADLEDLYRICLLTGAEGKDATALYREPRLPGHFYAAPYAVRDPLLCLIACEGGRPAGYILGTEDSARFGEWSEGSWFPALREKFARPSADDRSADAQIVRLIHEGYRPPSEAGKYPAHLHIDLLPSIQGRGIGRQLIILYLDLLRARGARGVHLGVSARNTGALAFYEAVGFHELSRDEGGRMYGLKLVR